MANKEKDSAKSGSHMLTIIWLLVSAGLAYPVYSMLASWGVNSALAVTIVFIGVCLLYDIPYRARVKAQNELAMRQSDQWRGRHC
jgi:hypothetical protein